jgi:muramoyltetrapeptide carboxypeptidase
MLPLIRPPRLQKGDTVALLSPASAPATPSAVKAAGLSLSVLGLKIRLGKHVLSREGYLAGTDEQRNRDLENAFRDPEIKAIFCTRGGYGSARLLERFDVRLARQHPKIVVGYSDLTCLHLALQAQGLVSFWGPMPGVAPGLNAFSARYLQKALMSAEPLGAMPVRRGVCVTLRPGRAEGALTGGTLTLLAGSLGTAYAVSTRNRIVFLEDEGEEPYKVDRLLTQLLGAGKLKDAAGVVLGVFTNAKPKVFSARRSWSLREVWADRLLPLNIPVFSGLSLGHISNQITLPYGIQARMDARQGRLEILKPGVA